MSHGPTTLEEELRRLAPAFKDAVEPPTTLHTGIMARTVAVDHPASVRRLPRQLWPSIAGVALVLVAASAVGASIILRGHHDTNVIINHPSPTPSPIATPAPTPAPTAMTQQLQVASSTPVILYHDPVNFDQIDAATWDGSVKGRLGVNPVAGTGVYPNPSGTLWATTQDIRDRAGSVVATLTTPTKGFPGTWADDGQHYCSMGGKSPFGQLGGEPTMLQVTSVGSAPRNIVQVGRAYEQTSVGVAACSIHNDLAVAVQANSTGQAVQFWVVQLSSGRILWTRNPSGDIRASHDGRYIAEVSYNQATQLSRTTIYSSTGKVLGQVDGDVEAFSWDGSLAVQTANYGAQVSVIRWRDGAVVWKGPSDGGFYGALPEPGGGRIAVSVRNPKYSQTTGFAPVDVYVIDPNGKAVQILEKVLE